MGFFDRLKAGLTNTRTAIKDKIDNVFSMFKTSLNILLILFIKLFFYFFIKLNGCKSFSVRRLLSKTISAVPVITFHARRLWP